MIHHVTTKVRAFLTRYPYRATLLLTLAALQCVAVFLMMTERGYRADEAIHNRVVKSVARGVPFHEMEELQKITNIPGYHVSLGLVARAVKPLVWWDERFPRQRHIRFLSTLIYATAFVTAIIVLLRIIGAPPRIAPMIALLPLVSTYLMVVYTDIAALALFLWGVVAAVRARHGTAALLFVATLLVRQDYIVFIAVLALLVTLHAVRTVQRPAIGDVQRALPVALPYMIVGALFCTFYIINGGVAMGDKSAHPTMWRAGNVYGGMIYAALAAAPVVAYGVVRAVRTLVRARRMGVVAALMVVGWFVYDATFAVTHGYNFDPRFLHNTIAMAVAQPSIWRVLGYGAVVSVVLMLWGATWRVPRVVVRSAMAASVVALGLHWLIEPRYVLPVAVAVLLVMRLPRYVVAAQIVYGALFAVWAYWTFLAHGGYFL